MEIGFFFHVLKDDIFLSDYRVQRVSGSFKNGVRGVIKRVRRVCVGGIEVLGDGGRERLRGLAGSCSSVVARERHVTRCLATLSNGGRLLQRPHPPRQFPWQPVKSLNGRFRRRRRKPVGKRGPGEGQVDGLREQEDARSLARSLSRFGRWAGKQ